MAKLTTDFVRVLTSRKTIDDRRVTPKQIQQMAANYDPNLYAALIWWEHFRFAGNFGQVLALKAEEIEDGIWGLFAQLRPTDRLLTVLQGQQKAYTSIEMDPSFSDTGEAYLVGLAITDSPASLGTERLEFSQKRMDHDGEIHSSKEPFQLTLKTNQGLLSRLFKSHQDTDMTKPTETSDNKTDKPNNETDAVDKLGELFSKLDESVTKLTEKVEQLSIKPAESTHEEEQEDPETPATDEADITKLGTQFKELSDKITQLTERLEKSTDDANRPENKGDTVNTTDC